MKVKGPLFRKKWRLIGVTLKFTCHYRKGGRAICLRNQSLQIVPGCRGCSWEFFLLYFLCFPLLLDLLRWLNTQAQVSPMSLSVPEAFQFSKNRRGRVCAGVLLL